MPQWKVRRKLKGFFSRHETDSPEAEDPPAADGRRLVLRELVSIGRAVTEQSRAERFAVKKKSRTRRMTSGGTEAALIALDVIEASTDVFPPLKSVFGFLHQIVSLSQQIEANKEDAKRLYIKAEAFGLELHEAASGSLIRSPKFQCKLERLTNVLEDIANQLDRLCHRRSLWSRTINARKHAKRITDLGERFDEAVRFFETGCIIRSELAIERLSGTDSYVLRNMNLAFPPPGTIHDTVGRLNPGKKGGEVLLVALSGLFDDMVACRDCSTKVERLTWANTRKQ